MKRTLVVSSTIRSVGYDEGTRTLEVEFNNGSTYQYDDVPAKEYRALLSAESVGKQFHKSIKPNFKFKPAPHTREESKCRFCDRAVAARDMCAHCLTAYEAGVAAGTLGDRPKKVAAHRVVTIPRRK